MGQYEITVDSSIRIYCLNNRLTTLMTSQGSDTVTSIFKCYVSNTIQSLRLLKIA